VPQSSTKDIDHGWKEFTREVKDIKGSYTKVGFPSDSKAKEEDGGSVVDIALYNQFGVPSKNIPARPFMSLAYDKNKHKINEFKAKQYELVKAKKSSAEKALMAIGEFMIGLIRKEITDLKEPANKESTKKRKGSSNPLIDTGIMRSSVTQSINMKGKNV